MTDYDSPWKEALDDYLPWFLEFFFPVVHAGMDWDRPYEILDKELEQIVGEGELGKRLADKLYKVWRKDGQEVWILIHIEVQSQRDNDFPKRMYIYHYRIHDKFDRPVVSLAVLADESSQWRPCEYGYEEYGCQLRFLFPIVKLLDYKNDLEALEQHDNPFALLTLIHLQTQATHNADPDRCDLKIHLSKGLMERNWEPKRIRKFLKFIDWMMTLPDILKTKVRDELVAYTKEKQMPYITSYEQFGIEKGLEKGREEGREEGERLLVQKLLEDKYGPLSPTVPEKLQQWPKERLVQLIKDVCDGQTLKELGLED